MATVLDVEGKSPTWGQDCFIAPNATLVGDVAMGERCSVWFNAVVRGDVHWIRIGDQTNVQDNAVLHCTYQQAPLSIGSYVTIAHSAIVHGCTVEDKAMIGMGAIVMDHARIGQGAIIAAGAVVLENTEVPPNTIFAGTPAKQIKTLDANNQAMLQRISGNYVKYASWFQQANEA